MHRACVTQDDDFASFSLFELDSLPFDILSPATLIGRLKRGPLPWHEQLAEYIYIMLYHITAYQARLPRISGEGSVSTRQW